MFIITFPLTEKKKLQAAEKDLRILETLQRDDWLVFDVIILWKMHFALDDQ